jgi:type IV pilus assembly protein PilC
LKKCWPSPTNKTTRNSGDQHGFSSVQRHSRNTVFEWEGKDRNGKQVRGEIRASGENQVQASLRRQGVFPTKIKKRRMRSGKRIKPKDWPSSRVSLATMMKAGVPLLQAFDIVGVAMPTQCDQAAQRHPHRRRNRYFAERAAFRKLPDVFRQPVLQPGRSRRSGRYSGAVAGPLAVYMEKTEAIKSKIKSALMYPISVLMVAFVVVP